MFGAFGASAECPELPSYKFCCMVQAASSQALLSLWKDWNLIFKRGKEKLLPARILAQENSKSMQCSHYTSHTRLNQYLFQKNGVLTFFTTKMCINVGKKPPFQEWKMTTKSNHMKAQCFASGNICTYSTLSFHKYILVNSTLAMGITVLRTVMTTNYPRKTASATA